MVIFGAHTLNSLARALPPSAPLSLPDYSHIHSRITLGLQSLIHTLLRSLIHSHNCTHPLAHLIVHAFHHSPTDLLFHSFLRSKIRSFTQLFTQLFPTLVLIFTHYPIIHTFTKQLIYKGKHFLYPLWLCLLQMAPDREMLSISSSSASLPFVRGATGFRLIFLTVVQSLNVVFVVSLNNLLNKPSYDVTVMDDLALEGTSLLSAHYVPVYLKQSCWHKFVDAAKTDRI